MATKESIHGSLLGLMAGDSLGLPYEGLSARRVKKFLKGELKQGLVLGAGMVSDDTEHAVMTAQAAARYSDDADKFQRHLAWRLRWWFARLPAGIGLATGRAIIKLWLGFPATRSGVFSAGNGPAMRAPILGVMFGGSASKMKAYVKASTQLTHTDPKAYIGALAVAHAAFCSARGGGIDAGEFRIDMATLLDDVDPASRAEFDELLALVVAAASEPDGLSSLVENLQLQAGVTGYMYHTVPVVLAIALSKPGEIKDAIHQVIALGGDTDTTAAILGGVLGADTTNLVQLAPDLAQVRDWPLSLSRVKAIADEVHRSQDDSHKATFGLQIGPAVFVRNMVFLTIVLLHGFRRLLPPY